MKDKELFAKSHELIDIVRVKKDILEKEKKLREEVLNLLGDFKVLETPIGRIERCERRTFKESLSAKRSLAQLKKELKELGEIVEEGTTEYLKVLPDKSITLRIGGD